MKDVIKQPIVALGIAMAAITKSANAAFTTNTLPANKC